MKHIFASGEEIYKKNIKELEHGTFIAKSISYENISEDTVFQAEGMIKDKPVLVEFKIKADHLGDIKFRHSVKILMQSDLMVSDWEFYKVNFV